MPRKVGKGDDTMAYEDFSSFFEELHGKKPFPWQADMARYVVEKKH